MRIQGLAVTQIEITQAQHDALNQKFLQNPDGSVNFFEFKKRVLDHGDYIMIHWCGMWLGIEKDGYTHS